MSYKTAVGRLYELGHELAHTPSHKFDLAHMRVLLGALGQPERRFRPVLVAGTNGKGSTAATLASILRAAGHKTGLYTSPHLVRINERIRINGEQISDMEFAPLHDVIDDIAVRLVETGDLPWHPSFFEMLTAMAFLHFADNVVDIAVLEVGMGGRLDATNVVQPLVSVITDISLDHQKFLGDTITEIAREKAGIIRRGGVVVTLPQHPEANDIIGNTILACGATAVSAAPFVPPVSPGAPKCTATDPQPEGRAFRNRYPLEVMGACIQIDSPLIGRHQLRNIALAIAAAEQLTHFGLKITPGDVERGVRDTCWPGRFQTLPASGGFPEFVLDGAHNPAGAWALRSALSERYGERPLTMVFGVMRDKAVGEITEILFPIAQHVITTQAKNPRSATSEEIRAAAARTGVELAAASDVPSALRRAAELTPQNGVVVIAGSIYIVGEALAELERLTGERLT